MTGEVQHSSCQWPVMKCKALLSFHGRNPSPWVPKGTLGYLNSRLMKNYP